MRWPSCPRRRTPEPLQPNAEDEGRTRADRRAAVERELVLRLRRPRAGRRRLDPARPDPQPGPRLDQRAAVRTGHADHRRAGLRGAAARATTPTSRADGVDLDTRGRRTACSPTGCRCAAGARPTTIRPTCCAARPAGPSTSTMDLTWTTVGTPYQYRISTALRDPVHGVGNRDGRRPTFVRVHRRRPASATTRGRRGTGGAWSGCGARCTSTTAPTSTASTCGSPVRRRWPPATCSARASRSSNCRRVVARETFGDDDLPVGTDARADARRPHRDHRRPRARAGAADLARRPGEPVPAGVGHRDDRRRPHRRRLAGVEPQPGRERLSASPIGCCSCLRGALLEIGGAWLVWQGIREHRGWLWAGAGVLALGAYGFVAAFQPDANFGRVLAAYGGMFIAGSLLWGMVADGFRPDRWDVDGRGGLPARRRPDHVRPALGRGARRRRRGRRGAAPSASRRGCRRRRPPPCVIGVSVRNSVPVRRRRARRTPTAPAGRSCPRCCCLSCCARVGQCAVRRRASPRAASRSTHDLPLVVVVVAAAHDELAGHPVGERSAARCTRGR